MTQLALLNGLRSTIARIISNSRVFHTVRVEKKSYVNKAIDSRTSSTRGCGYSEAGVRTMAAQENAAMRPALMVEVASAW